MPYTLRLCLDTAYFAQTKKIIIKSTVDKEKVGWNSTVRPMNSAKKCSRAHE